MSEYHDWCAECSGPVRSKTKFEVIRDTLAYELWMVLPTWLAFSPLGFFLLQYAGGLRLHVQLSAKGVFVTALSSRAAAAGAIAFTVLWMVDRVIAGVVQCPAAGSCPW